MEKFFQLKKQGTTVKTEILAGMTTFMTMAYILMVNPGMFSELGVVSYHAIFIATALSAMIGTLLIGLLANLPLAQASGMGLNAFFVYTVCFGFGLSYANALVLVLLDGIIFIILTITGIREKIFSSIPDSVRIAIPAGIGLFIAFIGLQDAGLIIANSSTCVTLASFNIFNGNATWADVMPLLITIFTLIFIAVMSAKQIKGAVFFGILGGSVCYYLLGFTVTGFYEGFSDKLQMNPFSAFQEFGTQAFGKVFTEGFDFSAYLSEHSMTGLVILIISTSLAFCLVDMFDTLGTLYGACSRGNLLTKDGKIPNFEKAMLSDAIATVFGSICGTSTVSTYVESSAGIAEGGRTGLSSIVTAGLFFIAMFLSPIAALIPGCATSPVIAVPAFLAIAMMPFSYNISYGIAFGLIAYIFIKLFTGKWEEIKIGTWIIGILFAIMFFITH